MEMDWDYSPTTASLCYEVDDTSQASSETFPEQYFGMAGAWDVRDSTDSIGSSDLGSAMEICEQGEVSLSLQEDSSVTYQRG